MISLQKFYIFHSKVVPREIDKADYLYIFYHTKLLYAMKYGYINPVYDIYGNIGKKRAILIHCL